MDEMPDAICYCRDLTRKQERNSIAWKKTTATLISAALAYGLYL